MVHSPPAQVSFSPSSHSFVGHLHHSIYLLISHLLYGSLSSPSNPSTNNQDLIDQKGRKDSSDTVFGKLLFHVVVLLFVTLIVWNLSHFVMVFFILFGRNFRSPHIFYDNFPTGVMWSWWTKGITKLF